MIGLGGTGHNIVTSSPDLFPLSHTILINMDARVLLLKEELAGCFYLGNKSPYSVNNVRHSLDDVMPEIIAALADVSHVVIVSGASGTTGSQASYLAKKLILGNKKVAIALMKPMTFESRGHSMQSINDLNAIAEQCFWHKVFSCNLSAGDRLDTMDKFIDKTNKDIMSHIVSMLNENKQPVNIKEHLKK